MVGTRARGVRRAALQAAEAAVEIVKRIIVVVAVATKRPIVVVVVPLPLRLGKTGEARGATGAVARTEAHRRPTTEHSVTRH